MKLVEPLSRSSTLSPVALGARKPTPAMVSAHQALVELAHGEKGLGGRLHNLGQDIKDVALQVTGWGTEDSFNHSPGVQRAVAAVTAMNDNERVEFVDYITQQPHSGALLNGIHQAVSVPAWRAIYAPVAAALERCSIQPLDQKTYQPTDQLDPKTKLRLSRHVELTNVAATLGAFQFAARFGVRFAYTAFKPTSPGSWFKQVRPIPGVHVSEEFVRREIQPYVRAGDFLFDTGKEGDRVDASHALVVSDAGDHRDPKSPMEVSHVNPAFNQSNRPAMRLAHLFADLVVGAVGGKKRRAPNGFGVESINSHMAHSPRTGLVFVRPTLANGQPLSTSQVEAGLALIESFRDLGIRYDFAFEDLDGEIECSSLMRLFLMGALGIIRPFDDAEASHWINTGRKGAPFVYDVKPGEYISMRDVNMVPLPVAQQNRSFVKRDLVVPHDAAWSIGDVVVRTASVSAPSHRETEGRVVEHRC
ncbi:MAG: hypothetical protein AAF219_07305 [Myxococcota bacterium]